MMEQFTVLGQCELGSFQGAFDRRSNISDLKVASFYCCKVLKFLEIYLLAFDAIINVEMQNHRSFAKFVTKFGEEWCRNMLSVELS